MTFALGRRPHDPTRLAAVPRHRMGAAGPLPASVTPFLTAPVLGHNDTAPDCVSVAAFNGTLAWGLKHGLVLPAPDQAIFDFYGAVCPCAPTLPAIEATDGLVVLSAMDRLISNGLFNGTDTIGAEVRAIDPTDVMAIRDAVFTLASASVGIDLYEGDMQEPLDWTGAPSGALVGGHNILVVGYDADGWTVATWGILVRCSLAWLAARAREAYAIRWLMQIAAV